MADSVNTEYQVNIPVFEGPMDLLLHLVTKNRIDIHDIPIQRITSQYLDYLNAASEFDLELGSSFFAMASTLLLIKSRVLLPKRRQEETGDESEQEDPRGELARSLETFLLPGCRPLSLPFMMRFMKRRHAGCLRKRFPLKRRLKRWEAR